MNRIKKLLKTDKVTKIIFACGMLGIVLVFISTLSFGKDNKSQSVSSVDYAANLEDKLTKVVGKITGEDSVSVMVSLDSTGEVVYADARNITTNSISDSQADSKLKTEYKDDSEQNYIIIENADGSQQALVKSELAPSVCGVVVVTAYADNPAVAGRITSAVTTVLNIPSKKVCVVAAS